MIDRIEPHVLAEALVFGARAEVDLTPKPGLVDRYDSGSHPDLDHARMMCSIDLLPRYYEELIRIRIGAGRWVAEGDTLGVSRCPTAGREVYGVRFGVASSVRSDTAPSASPEASSSLAACIDAGRRAEARMEEAIGTNAHRGYIFLSGLVLLAACDLVGTDGAGAAAKPPSGGSAGAVVGLPSGDGVNDPVVPPSALRRAVVSVARGFFAADRSPGADRPGARVRGAHRLGGVRAEALAGLPSVFEVGLPAYLAARSDLATFHALAVLMQSVEDTTAVSRCGVAGLARLRRDGAALQALLDRGDDPRLVLGAWNEEYRTQRLTMGGVADCLALVLALAVVVCQDSSGITPPSVVLRGGRSDPACGTRP
jgi:triphosphoribosyl-dephospho-CoA synthase